MQQRPLSAPIEAPSKRSEENEYFYKEIVITPDVIKEIYARKRDAFLSIALRYLKRYTPRSGGMAPGRSQLEALAEDSVQEAFVAVLSKKLPEDLNTRARLYGYIDQVIRSKAVDLIRERDGYRSVRSFHGSHDDGVERVSNDDYARGMGVRHSRMRIPTQTHMRLGMKNDWKDLYPPSEEVAALEERVDALRHMTDAALLYDYVLREGNVFGHVFTRGGSQVTEENFERMKEVLRMEAFGLSIDKKIQRLASLGMISQKDADDPAAYKRLKNLIHQTFHRAKEHILADMDKRDIFTPINDQK